MVFYGRIVHLDSSDRSTQIIYKVLDPLFSYNVPIDLLVEIKVVDKPSVVKT